jgi:hypothetical protein
LSFGSTSSTWRYFVLVRLSALTKLTRVPLPFLEYQLTSSSRCPSTTPPGVASALPVMPCGHQ